MPHRVVPRAGTRGGGWTRAALAVVVLLAVAGAAIVVWRALVPTTRLQQAMELAPADATARLASAPVACSLRHTTDTPQTSPQT